MPKILIVEDSVSIRDELSFILKMEGYEVIEADNGLSGLELTEKESPDLILSDISMPHMDGIEFYERVKEDGESQNIPFVFLTAKVGKDDIRAGMNLGADDYITKPFLTEDILNTIKTRLDKKALLDKELNSLKFNIRSRLPKRLLKPLNSIIGYSYVIKESLSKLNKDDLSDMIESIHNSSLILSKLVENYLLLTDLETLSIPELKELSTSDKRFKITNSKSLKEIIRVYESDNYRNNEFEKQIENINLQISPDHFDKIISEIINNAVKHSPRRSLIKIRAWMADDMMNFRCVNPYRSSSIEQMNKLKNCLSDEVRDRNNQVGLGLSIIKKIANLYGGSFNIEINEKLKDVVTTLRLPS